MPAAEREGPYTLPDRNDVGSVDLDHFFVGVAVLAPHLRGNSVEIRRAIGRRERGMDVACPRDAVSRAAVLIPSSGPGAV